MRWGTPSCKSKILTSCRQGWLFSASIMTSESPVSSKLHSVIVCSFFAFLKNTASALAMRGWPSRGGKSISKISSFGNSPIASKSWLLCWDDSFLKKGRFIRTCLQILWAENAWINRVITSESSSRTSFCVSRPWGWGVLSFRVDDGERPGAFLPCLFAIMVCVTRWGRSQRIMYQRIVFYYVLNQVAMIEDRSVMGAGKLFQRASCRRQRTPAPFLK